MPNKRISNLNPVTTLTDVDIFPVVQTSETKYVTSLKVQEYLSGKNWAYTGNLTLSSLMASSVPYLDASKKLSSSSVSATELGYLSGVSSAIQAQLDEKQASGNYITSLTGEATGSGAGAVAVTLLNSAVIGKLLTGYTSGSGIVSASDSLLQAIQKLNGNILLKADIASPSFTGVVILPTIRALSNSGILFESTGGADVALFGAGAGGNNTSATFYGVISGNSITMSGTYNKVTITQPASGATLTIINGKTLTVLDNTTLAGTPVRGTGVSTQIATWTGANVQTGSNGLIWNGSQIEIDSPTATGFKLTVSGANGFYFYNGAGAAGNFGMYDVTASLDRLIIKNTGEITMGASAFFSPSFTLASSGALSLTNVLKVNGATATEGALEVQGNVNLNNDYVASTGSLNQGYYVFKFAGTSYGMKLQYEGSGFGTLIVAPNVSSNFVGLGTVINTGATDADFVTQVRLATSTGNLGVNATQASLIDSSSGKFTVRQNNANSASLAIGWIAGTFGGNGGTGNVVVMGGYGDKAILGGHNVALSAWADLSINPTSSGNVLIGAVQYSNARLQVGGGTGSAGTGLSTQMVIEGGLLGGTTGNEINLGSFCFSSNNTSSLGIYAYRASSGSDWTSASIGLGMNVDNSTRASYAGNSNCLWINPNGNINVGSLPIYGGGNFLVAGDSSPYSSNTTYSSVLNYGSGGAQIDIFACNAAGFAPSTVGLSWTSNTFGFYINGTETARISTTGLFGFGVTSPTAKVHIQAGTTTVAPLKLTSGTNLTTAESGAFEFDGTNLYFTVGGVRKTVTLI